MGKLRPSAGFSLIELVVVVSIAAIVLAVLIPGIRQATDNFQLRKAATIAVTELRRAYAAAVAEGADYTVEFVLANPGSVKVYRSTATAETCPQGMLPSPPTTTTLCTRTVDTPEWPSIIAIDDPGTTFPACAAPADPANKCVTFKPMGYVDNSGETKLRVRNASPSWDVAVNGSGRVTIER